MATTDFSASLEQKTRTRFETYGKEALKKTHFSAYMNIENTSVFSEAYVDDEGGVSVGLLTEGGAVTYSKDNEGRQTVLTADVYAGKVKDTKHERLRAKDETVLFSKFLSKRVDKLILKMKYKMETSAALIFNDGFTGATLLAPDAKAIFDAGHTYKNGAAFSNQSPTNIAAGEAAMAELEAYGGAFTDADGEASPMVFDEIFVKTGGEAATKFKKVFKANGVQATVVDGVNIYNDGRTKLIEVPYINDSKAWFARASMDDEAFIFDIIENPTMGERVNDGNENYEQNATASWKRGCVSMPIAWYASKGTGVADV